MTKTSIRRKATKNRGKTILAQLALRTSPSALGQGDGQHEQDRDQAGHDRDLEDAGVGSVHGKNRMPSRTLATARLMADLDEVLGQDGQGGEQDDPAEERNLPVHG